MNARTAGEESFDLDHFTCDSKIELNKQGLGTFRNCEGDIPSN